MKKQVVVIGGGDVFRTRKEFVSFLKKYKIDDLDYFSKKGWKNSLQKELGKSFEVIRPEMPNKFDARYSEWKIWFEKLLLFIRPNAVFVGHSLGGIFLAKYLSENTLGKRPKAVILIAAPFDDEEHGYLGDFKLIGSLDRFSKQCKNIYLFQSKDDPVVPFHEVDKYKRALPNAEVRVLKNRGHFNQAKFPELVKYIKSL